MKDSVNNMSNESNHSNAEILLLVFYIFADFVERDVNLNNKEVKMVFDFQQTAFEFHLLFSSGVPPFVHFGFQLKLGKGKKGELIWEFEGCQLPPKKEVKSCWY